MRLGNKRRSDRGEAPGNAVPNTTASACAAVLIGLLFAPMPSSAEGISDSITVEKVVEGCILPPAPQTPAELHVVEFFMGYIRGILDGAWGTSHLEKIAFCPSVTSAVEVCVALRRWIEKHPESLHEPAGVAIIRSIGEGRSCKD